MRNYIFQCFLTLKNSLVSFLSAISLFLAPSFGIVFILFLMVCLDFITGAIAAKKRNEFKSYRVMDSIWKFLQFSVAVLLAHAIDVCFISKIDLTGIKFLFNDGIVDFISHVKCLSMLSFIIIVREISSMDENWVKANGWSILGSISEFVNSKILSLLKKTKTNE